MLTTIAWIALAAASPAVEPRPFVRIAGGKAFVRFDETEGTRLDAFADVVAEVVEKEIVCADEEVGAKRLRYAGIKVMPARELWSYFLSVVEANRAYVDVCDDRTFPTFCLYSTRPPRRGCLWLRRRGPIVRPHFLGLYRHDEGVRLTTSFTMAHADASAVVALLRRTFDAESDGPSAYELTSLRSVSVSNAMVVTGDGPTLFAARELVRFLDVEREVPIAAARVALQESVSADAVKRALDDWIAWYGAPVHTVADAPAGVLVVLAPAPDLAAWVTAAGRGEWDRR